MMRDTEGCGSPNSRPAREKLPRHATRTKSLQCQDGVTHIKNEYDKVKIGRYSYISTRINFEIEFIRLTVTQVKLHAVKIRIPSQLVLCADAEARKESKSTYTDAIILGHRFAGM
jgi:hypothetical protein